MTAATYNFEIEQGTTFNKSFVWKDSSKNPINLTGFSGRMQIRSSVKSADVLLSLTTENTRISITPLTGMVNILIDATTTAAITWSKGVYDLELVGPGNVVTRLLQGEITISKEVTR
jgi:hypothetical protein